MKFRLVDRILDWTPYQRITGIKVVSFEEYCLKEPFGEEGWLPETLLLESLLQLGNWLILLSTDFKQMGLVIRLSEVRFHGRLLPGQQLRMEVTVARHREEGFELCGEGSVIGRALITGVNCLAAPVPAAEDVYPDDLRVLFTEIHQPTQAA
jgi:3-hydroxyacyl-[acyl-carrier-protein] dehydratase